MLIKYKNMYIDKAHNMWKFGKDAIVHTRIYITIMYEISLKKSNSIDVP